MAQPCFYIDYATGQYNGPPELLAGNAPADIVNFCAQSINAGFFDQPLCDLSTLPGPPACLSPEQRQLLTYCAERGFEGDDPVSNYFCWIALKAPALLTQWVNTPDCLPGQVPPPSVGPGPGPMPLPVGPGPGPTPIAPAPTEGDSIVVPVLLGAAAIGAALYFLG